MVDIFKRLAEKYPGFGQRMREAGALGRWDVCVGEGIAKHARPIRVMERILWVEVDHPAWKTELLFRKRQILERLNQQAAADEAPLADIFFTDKK